MSFTSLAIIKKHLLSPSTNALAVDSVPVTLNGEDEVLLPHQNLLAGSAVVKWDTGLLPLRDDITLTDYDKNSLSFGNIVPHSVVIAQAENMTAVYREEVDYRLDYLAGTVARTEGSGIPNNALVQVYYSCYSLFESGTDYDVDYLAGTIRRHSGSTIPDGATLLADYQLTTGSISDELIGQAILEAEDLIVRSLSEDYNSLSTDQGLQTGTTLLVMSILTRDLAAEVLGRRTGTDAGGRAKEWQNLSALYETRAWQTLRPFLDRYPAHSPQRQPNANL